MYLSSKILGAVLLFSVTVFGIPISEDSIDIRDPIFQNYLDQVVNGPGSQSGWSHQELLDYIKVLEMELAEVTGSKLPELAGMGDYNGPNIPSDVHNVDKRRRRRYGFWITAINKMGNGGKRSLFKRASKFIPVLGSSPAKFANLPNYE